MNKILKRIGMFVISGVIAVSASVMPTMAAHKETDMVTYDGRSFKKDILSQETVEWIEWYEGLGQHLYFQPVGMSLPIIPNTGTKMVISVGQIVTLMQWMY